jgi:hypothetical protein
MTQNTFVAYLLLLALSMLMIGVRFNGGLGVSPIFSLSACCLRD